ncbi:hypothetical protein ACFYE8_33295 [Rhizobium leguminosarum]|uniref:hypothetical protein n=1 Tax=Rhizobium leguminosarum TaxID=384 RepID=UPI0036DAC3AF
MIEDVPGAMSADWVVSFMRIDADQDGSAAHESPRAGRCVYSLLARLNESIVLGVIQILEQIEDAPKRIHLSHS